MLETTRLVKENVFDIICINITPQTTNWTGKVKNFENIFWDSNVPD